MRESSSAAAATRRVAAMFDEVAPRYDLLNRLMSLGRDARWRERLVLALRPAPGARVLDVGCGTGDVALALARAGARPVGLDSSRAMLRLAKRKAPGLDWVQGDALHLPFKEGSLGGAASAFVLRNLPDRAAAFGEQARVLRPGARAAHLELVRPPRGPRRWLHGAYVLLAVPALGLLSPNRAAYRYLARSVLEVPEPERFARELEEAGLEAARLERAAAGAVAVAAAAKPGPGKA